MSRYQGPTVAERDAMASGMLPVATDLVCQVRDWNAGEIRQLLMQFGEDGLRTLCVVLAAMVPDDCPLDDLLAWTHEEPWKPCSRCGTSKPLGDFPKTRARSTGRHHWCKDCHNGAKRKPVLTVACDQRRAS